MNEILAIVGLRFKLASRRMRGSARLINLIGGVLIWIFGAAVSLGLAAGLGGLTYWAVGSVQQDILRAFLATFWICALFGLGLPLLRGTLDQGFDAAPFLVYPIRRRRLYAITLCAGFGSPEHLFYVPSLIAVIVVGMLMSNADPLVQTALVLLLFFSLVVWSQVAVLALVGLMRGRRVREFIGLTMLIVVVAASFVPALIDGWFDRPKEAAGSVTVHLGPLIRAAEVLPPTLAARGVSALHRGGTGAAAALGYGLALAGWNALGIGLGYLVFSRFHLGRRSAGARAAGTSARRSRRRRGWSFDSAVFSGLAPQVRAVAAKELHYLTRSMNGRLILVLSPGVVLILTALVGDWLDEPLFGIDPERLMLFGILLYAVVFSSNFLFNTFAWEGNGVAGYFSGPIEPRQVFIGKNLAVWLYNAIIFPLVLLTWSVAMGLPDLPTLLTSLLLFASAMVTFTACGNLASVAFPLKRDLSSMMNSPSQMALLLSILALALVVIVTGPFLSVPLLLGWRWLQVLALAFLLAGVSGAYLLALGLAARLLVQRKERLIEALKDAR